MKTTTILRTLFWLIPAIQAFSTTSFPPQYYESFVGYSSRLLFLHPGRAGTGDGWVDPAAPVNSVESLEKTLRKSIDGQEFHKRLSILGSTGSIGTQTLEIVDACGSHFTVDALSAGTNVELMAQQVKKYQPKIVSMATAEAATALKDLLIAMHVPPPEILCGKEGIVAVATVDTSDTVVTGIVGAAGLQPTMEAIKSGKDIALANKETLISGGPLINPLLQQYGVEMVRTWA